MSRELRIFNNGINLKIVSDLQPHYIMKSLIQEITVVKDDIIKIDTGNGALRMVYIPFVDVVEPVASSPQALADILAYMLVASATEINQVIEINQINTLNEIVNNINSVVQVIDSKQFYSPVYSDEKDKRVIYKGYSLAPANDNAPVWAIQRITNVDEFYSYFWADGNKKFDNVWAKRTTLPYS